MKVSDRGIAELFAHEGIVPMPYKEKAVKVPLKQHEFDALVSFHFNTGAISRASFVKKLNAGDRAGAARGMLDWNKPPEIIKRRQAEERLFRTGVYSGDGRANVYPATAAGRVLWGEGKRVEVASLIGAPRPANTHDAVPVEDLPKAPNKAPSAELPAPGQAVNPTGFWAALFAALSRIFKRG